MIDKSLLDKKEETEKLMLENNLECESMKTKIQKKDQEAKELKLKIEKLKNSIKEYDSKLSNEKEYKSTLDDKMRAILESIEAKSLK